jgi:hypothetical protein
MDTPLPAHYTLISHESLSSISHFSHAPTEQMLR